MGGSRIMGGAVGVGVVGGEGGEAEVERRRTPGGCMVRVGDL